VVTSYLCTSCCKSFWPKQILPVRNVYGCKSYTASLVFTPFARTPRDACSVKTSPASRQPIRVRVRKNTVLYFGPVLKLCLSIRMENQCDHEFWGCLMETILEHVAKKQNKLSSRIGSSTRTKHLWAYEPFQILNYLGLVRNAVI
jgi:hypothetical protein